MRIPAAARRRARLRAWVARTEREVRRAGGTLRLEAPHPVFFDGAPHVRAVPDGGAGGTWTLRLGRNVSLGRELSIDLDAGADNLLEIGDGTGFGFGGRLQLRGGASRSRPSTQGRDGVVLKSAGALEIGEWAVLSHGTMVHCTEAVTVGERVGIGERVSLIDSDHGADGSDVFYLDQPLRTAPVTLGRNVLVSANAVILRGSTVGPNAVVAAGAVLTGGRYPAGWIIAGVPARPLTSLPMTPP